MQLSRKDPAHPLLAKRKNKWRRAATLIIFLHLLLLLFSWKSESGWDGESEREREGEESSIAHVSLVSIFHDATSIAGTNAIKFAALLLLLLLRLRLASGSLSCCILFSFSFSLFSPRRPPPPSGLTLLEAPIEQKLDRERENWGGGEGGDIGGYPFRKHVELDKEK